MISAIGLSGGFRARIRPGRTDVEDKCDCNLPLLFLWKRPASLNRIDGTDKRPAMSRLGALRVVRKPFAYKWLLSAGLSAHAFECWPWQRANMSPPSLIPGSLDANEDDNPISGT